ncbi:MAG: hypothetical protein PHE27_01250 [Alphaproteobacteria bacterium]|nr:hypothetical protein [Alphaproteobacteria bacterium]
MEPDFNEAAKTACRLVKGCLLLNRIPYVDKFILNSMNARVDELRIQTLGREKDREYMACCLTVIEDASRVCRAIEDYWAASFRQGQPMNWSRIYDTLAVNGKTESFIVKTSSELRRETEPLQSWREQWELHERDIESKKDYLWTVTPFTLEVAGDNAVQRIEIPTRSERLLRGHLSAGLEAVGKKTPTC